MLRNIPHICSHGGDSFCLRLFFWSSGHVAKHAYQCFGQHVRKPTVKPTIQRNKTPSILILCAFLFLLGAVFLVSWTCCSKLPNYCAIFWPAFGIKPINKKRSSQQQQSYTNHGCKVFCSVFCGSGFVFWSSGRVAQHFPNAAQHFATIWQSNQKNKKQSPNKNNPIPTLAGSLFVCFFVQWN